MVHRTSIAQSSVHSCEFRGPSKGLCNPWYQVLTAADSQRNLEKGATWLCLVLPEQASKKIAVHMSLGASRVGMAKSQGMGCQLSSTREIRDAHEEIA